VITQKTILMETEPAILRMKRHLIKDDIFDIDGDGIGDANDPSSMDGDQDGTVLEMVMNEN